MPLVDTVLFLRPTESATVFLQQLGRGLRRAEGKDCLTVLDFIGRASRHFRFDRRFRAITGGTRASVATDVEEGFPRLPAGCAIRLDRVASEIVLDNIRKSIGGTFRSLVRELQVQGPAATLRQFLENAGVELEDVYRSPGWCWSALRQQAGYDTANVGPYRRRLTRGLGRLLHTDDPLRIRTITAALRAGRVDDRTLPEDQRRMLTGFLFTLWGTADLPGGLSQLLSLTDRDPAVADELQQLLELLEERAPRVVYPLRTELEWQHPVPLCVHARYALDEILAAVGRSTISNPYRVREGVMFDEATKSDLFFVTLDKNEERYSPTTMYKDYAISPFLFHWESQSGLRAASPTGQRYVNHRARGSQVLLFVRRTPKEGGRTAPYTFLGPVDYMSHRGERPMGITWKLRRAMPAEFFREAKVAVG